MTDDFDDLIPTWMAAEILGVSVATMNRLSRSGRVPVAHQAPGVRGARFLRLEDVKRLSHERRSQ